jgi:sugar/nucleoside kinase (ribokinase family)
MFPEDMYKTESINRMDKKEYDGVFIGTAAFDLLFLVDRQPGSDERVRAREIQTGGGGPAATAAVSFASLGGKTAMIGAVGNDLFGRLVREELRTYDIDTTGILIREEGQTPVASMNVEKSTGRRSITMAGGCLYKIGISDIDTSPLHRTRIVHLDGNNPKLALEAARYCKEKTSAVVSLDGGNMEKADVLPLLPYVDVFIPDDKTAAKILGNADYAEGCRIFHGLGPDVAGITLGERGSVFYIDGEPVRTDSIHDIPIVDTTGAGDNFHGAFLYAYTLGWDLRVCVKFATIFAALTCRGLGGRSAIPAMSEVLARMDRQ